MIFLSDQLRTLGSLMSSLVPTEWSEEPQPGHKMTRISCDVKLGCHASSSLDMLLAERVIFSFIFLSNCLLFPHPGTWTLYLWSQGEGPKAQGLLYKPTWSLSLTGIQSVQLGASAFTLGSTPVPVADRSLPFLQQRSMNLYSRWFFLGPWKSSHTFSFSPLWVFLGTAKMAQH